MSKPVVLLYDPLIMGHHLVYAANFTAWALARGYGVVFFGHHYQGSPYHRRFAHHPDVAFRELSPAAFAHRADFAALVREYGEIGFYYDKLRPILFDDDGPAIQIEQVRRLQEELRPELTVLLYGDEMWTAWDALAEQGDTFAGPTFLWLLYANGFLYDPCGHHARDIRPFLRRQRLFAGVATVDEYQIARQDPGQAVLRWLPDPSLATGDGPEPLTAGQAASLAELDAFLAAGDGPILLVPGLFEARKNAGWLIELAGRREDVSLVILGPRNLPGAEDAALEALLARLTPEGRAFVRFEHLPQPFFDQAFACPRVRLLPMPYRRHDLSSGVQLQALAHGVPTLVPDNGLMARRVLEHGLGAVFAHEDAAAFFRAAGKALEADRAAYAPACRAFMAHFTPEAWFAGVDRFLGLRPVETGPLLEEAARRDAALRDARPGAGRRAASWLLHQGLLFWNDGENARALDCWGRAAAADAGATRPVHLTAMLLAAQGRRAEGLGLLAALWDKRPEHPDILGWIDVVCDHVVKELPEEADFAVELAALARDCPRGALATALVAELADRVWYLIDRERIERAQRILAALLAAWPGNPDGLFVLAHVRLRQGHPEEAAELLDRFLAARPGHEDGTFVLAQVRLAQDRLDEAETLLHRVLAGNPGHADAVFFLAKIRLRQKRLDEAGVLLDRILADQPGHVEFGRCRGAVWAQQGDYDQAIPMFSRLIAAGDLEAYLNLSDCLRYAGRFDEAQAKLDRGHALGACPDGLYREKTGRIEAARAAVAKYADPRYAMPPQYDANGFCPGPVPAAPKGKVAVVDLLFGWPPHGGAPRDLHEVFRRLARTHHVRCILPALKDGLLTRGRMDAAVPFEVQLVPMEPKDFRDDVFGAKLKAAVDAFAPDAVFVGDGWAMKPVVAHALLDYKPVVRFYAYEVACFRGAGELFRDGRPCPDSWLKTLDRQDHRRCIECALEYYATVNPREAFFRRELVQAGAFEAGYPAFVADTLGKAGAIVCYNRIMAGIVSRHNPRTQVTPSGVDLEAFTPGDPAAVVPGQILFAGRVYDSKKGFAWVIEACDLLAARGVRFTLLCTGLGAKVERDYLKNIGWINQDGKLADYMASSSVCLVPSLWPEALGMTALEAMACGRPLVASRTGGLGELFTDGEEGFYLEPGDVAGLADALQRLLDNPELAQAMGRKGRALAEARYGWDDIVATKIEPLLFPGEG